MTKNDALTLFIESYFDDCDLNVRRCLDGVCRFHPIPRGEILFHEGQQGKDVYFLASGMIKLFRTNAAGKEVAVAFVTSGQLIAWLALQLEEQYPVSAISLESAELLRFDVNDTGELFRLSPVFARRMFVYLAERHRSYLNSIKDLALSEPRTRLLNYLNHLSGQSSAGTVRLPVPKKQIALLLGITPETLSRIFRQLTADRLISVRGREIQFRNATE